MSVRGTNEQHLIEYRKPAGTDQGSGGAGGEASGVAVTTGAPLESGVGGTGGVWRSRREEWDRRHRRLWLRRLIFH